MNEGVSFSLIVLPADKVLYRASISQVRKYSNSHLILLSIDDTLSARVIYHAHSTLMTNSVNSLHARIIYRTHRHAMHQSHNEFELFNTNSSFHLCIQTVYPLYRDAPNRLLRKICPISATCANNSALHSGLHCHIEPEIEMSLGLSGCITWRHRLIRPFTVMKCLTYFYCGDFVLAMLIYS